MWISPQLRSNVCKTLLPAVGSQRHNPVVRQVPQSWGNSSGPGPAERSPKEAQNPHDPELRSKGKSPEQDVVALLPRETSQQGQSVERTISWWPNKTWGTEPEVQGWRGKLGSARSRAPFCGAKDLPPRCTQPRKLSQQKLCHLLPNISKARGDTFHRWVGREGSRQEKKIASWGLRIASQACCVTLGKWLCLSEPQFICLYNEYK